MIEWSVATRALPGQTVSGDHFLVKASSHGVLVGVVDGLGHGDEATFAANAAVTILSRHSHESVMSLLRRCHEGLKQTRGVVMTLAMFSFNDSTLTWIGVGNVEAILLRADPTANPQREGVVMRGGVVGYQLPPLTANIVTVAPGDLLILASDGIRAGFSTGVAMKESPEKIANRILAQYSKGTDDALVLVARYVGRQHKAGPCAT